MKRLTVILAICVLSTTISAQKENTFFGHNGLRLTGAWGGASHSINKFDGQRASFSGRFGGLEFGKKLLVGWGHFDLNNSSNAIVEGRAIDMDYRGLILGLAPNATKKLHMSYGLMLGKGKVDLANLDSNDSDKIYVIQPSAGVELNVFRWFHVGLEGGYRFVRDSDIANLSNADISSPYANLRLKFGWSWGRDKSKIEF